MSPIALAIVVDEIGTAILAIAKAMRKLKNIQAPILVDEYLSDALVALDKARREIEKIVPKEKLYGKDRS